MGCTALVNGALFSTGAGQRARLVPLRGQRAVLVESVELAVWVQGVAHPPEQREQLLLEIVVLRKALARLGLSLQLDSGLGLAWGHTPNLCISVTCLLHAASCCTQNVYATATPVWTGLPESVGRQKRRAGCG